MDDFRLLRQYEPVLRFTHGELFFPVAVEPYLARTSLWQHSKNRTSELLVPAGDLTVDVLAAQDKIHQGQSLYLQFVQEPLRGVAFQRWLRRKERPRFRAPGRLARVGLFTRLVDSAFDLTLTLRGKVPGGTVAAAEIQYRDILAEQDCYTYYGRVTRESGYIILQYLFFFPMNNWRSTYYGVNDHEADWEQVFVFLAEQTHGDPIPVWTAYASHDFSGDNLRRRWDDPELERVGTHPVVYVGVGSHASYFQRGEYLTRVQIEYLKPIRNVLWQLRVFWSERLGQGSPTEQDREAIEDLISLPFVDYARGDGLEINPADWQPVVISDETDWIDDYRGLWGLDTRDPIQGENAPAGPKYNRDGTVRQSWNNPLGWAGLHKVPTPQRMTDILQYRVNELQEELRITQEELHELKRELPKLNLELQAMRQFDHLTKEQRQQSRRLEEYEFKLNQLYERETLLKDTLEATRVYLDDVRAGYIGDPQAHITQKHTPQTSDEITQNTLLESWSALSAGLLLIGFALLLFLEPAQFFIGTAALVLGFGVIEASLRRRLQELLLSISVILAVMTSFVLVYEFLWELLSAVVVGVALLIIVTNWRELRGV